MLWMSPSFFHTLHKMSDESDKNLEIEGLDSFFDLGSESFTLNKPLEVGPCFQRRFVNYLQNLKILKT